MLLVLWPGVVQGSFVTVALGPVTVAIAIGAALVGYAVSARPPRRRSASLRVGVTAIAIGIVVFALLMMLSVGALPGLYYPSPGSSRLAVDGCGGKGAPAARAYPGFPPDSHVELRWATGNGTPMQFTLWQKSPNSDRVAWQLAENGSFGQVSFVGDGGAAGWSSAGSAKTCPTDHIEYFTVSWSYTLAL